MDVEKLNRPFVDLGQPLDEEDDLEFRRRHWPVVVLSALIAVAAIGAALYVAASHYQPLSQSLGGGYGAQVLTSQGSLATTRAGGAPNTVAWTEPTGTFRVEVIVTLNNDQRFGVTIDKVLAPANPSGTSHLHVYFDSHDTVTGFYGYKGGPAFHPTSLGSKGALQLAVHWNQQCVPTSAQSRATTYTSLPVEYTFMGFHHTVNEPIKTLTITPRSSC